MSDQIATASPLPVNPYVGPVPIGYNQPIFGRDREIDELRDAVIAERIVLLYSPSGAGKTSLINAGVIPELQARNFRVLPTIRVNAEPPPHLDDGVVANRYLFSTLQSLEEGHHHDSARLSPQALCSMTLDEYLDNLDDDDQLDPLLIFDQFEELLTLDPTDQDAKADFMKEVGRTLRNRGRWALFSMREDFVTQLDPYLAFISTRLRAHYRLDLLEAEAAKLAIKGPAESRGVVFSDTAADQLVDDLRRVRVQRGASVVEQLGPHVEPVQLQVVCHRLWESLSL